VDYNANIEEKIQPQIVYLGIFFVGRTVKIFKQMQVGGNSKKVYSMR